MSAVLIHTVRIAGAVHLAVRAGQVAAAPEVRTAVTEAAAANVQAYRACARATAANVHAARSVHAAWQRTA